MEWTLFASPGQLDAVVLVRHAGAFHLSSLDFDLFTQTLRVNAGAYGVVLSHQGKQVVVVLVRLFALSATPVLT